MAVASLMLTEAAFADTWLVRLIVLCSWSPAARSEGCPSCTATLAVAQRGQAVGAALHSARWAVTALHWSFMSDTFLLWLKLPQGLAGLEICAAETPDSFHVWP